MITHNVGSRKFIVVGIMLLFIGTGLIPSVLSKDKQHSALLNPSPVIKVDNDGDGDYTKIQEAIDAANPGDTIEVYSGTYLEKIVVNKQLILKGIAQELPPSGNDTGKPVIDATKRDTVVAIKADDVTLSGFVIQNSKDAYPGVYVYDFGGVIINDNVIFNCTGYGLLIFYGSNVTVTKNTITKTGTGIQVFYNGNQFISGNTIISNSNGILLTGSSSNNISGNIIKDNTFFGISLDANSHNNIIFSNQIENNKNRGVEINNAHGNFIYLNNFVKNGQNAYDSSVAKNIWNATRPTGGNYWSDYTGTDADHDGFGDTPYSVPPGANKDKLPWMYMQDPYPPFVNITKPKEKMLYINNNEIIRFPFNLIIGIINITIDAFDNLSGLKRVELYIDGELKGNWTEPPFYYNWTKGTVLKCRHVLNATAYDVAGNKASMERNIFRIKIFY